MNDDDSNLNLALAIIISIGIYGIYEETGTFGLNLTNLFYSVDHYDIIVCVCVTVLCIIIIIKIIWFCVLVCVSLSLSPLFFRMCCLNVQLE